MRALSWVKVPTLLHAETLCRRPQYSKPPVQGEVTEGADNHGAGEQSRPVRKNMYGPRFRRGSLRRRQPREDGNEEDKEIKEMRPKVSSHLNVGIATTSITNADAQRALNHKMAKRQKQRIHQLGIHLLQRNEQAGLSKSQLTVATIIHYRAWSSNKKK